MQTDITVVGGGLAINEDLQWVRGDGSALARLYAAGNVGQGCAWLNGHGYHLGWLAAKSRR